MDAQMTFRSAFNGFNREDVVHYIEYINAKHAAEVTQLNSELEFLRNHAAQSETPAAPAADPQVDATIEEQAGRIRELFDRCKELEAELAAVKEEKAQLAAAHNLQPARQPGIEDELAAYRRAERTERLARERAEQMFRQANGALADATVKVDTAADQIGSLTDRVMAQLAELQAAVCDSKQALKDAAATMYTIRPERSSE